MGVSENLKRGVTELVLLSLLAQRDMYGYEMSQELQTRSSGNSYCRKVPCTPPFTGWRTRAISL